MTIAKGKDRYSITMSSDTYNIINYVSNETCLTRSQVIEILLNYCVYNINSLLDMVEYVNDNAEILKEKG